MKICEKIEDEYTSLRSGKGLGNYDNEKLLKNINKFFFFQFATVAAVN